MTRRTLETVLVAGMGLRAWKIYLNGEEQRYVTEAGPGYLVRGKRGEPEHARQTRLLPSGLLFDNVIGDFVLERVDGWIEVEDEWPCSTG